MALDFLKKDIENNEKEWKELDKESLGFDTPTKRIYRSHTSELKKIGKILEYYER